MSSNHLISNYIQQPNMWDEMFTTSGKVRKVYNNFGDFLDKVHLTDINQLQEFSNQLFMNQGVTFTVYDDDKGVERIFPFDIITSEFFKIPSSSFVHTVAFLKSISFCG